MGCRLQADSIVVTDKILDGIFRKQLFELGVKLRGECFIVRQHKCWYVQFRDDVRHSEGLTGAGRTQQNLMLHALTQMRQHFGNGPRLIASRLHLTDEFELTDRLPAPRIPRRWNL